MSMPNINAEVPSRALRDAEPAVRSSGTRTSRAWGWISFALAALVVGVIFALQNLKGVESAS